jgi:hypothetical protein
VHEQKSVPSDGKACELVKVGDGLRDYPANLAESKGDDREWDPGRVAGDVVLEAGQAAPVYR